MKITMVEVKSENIRSIGYDPESQTLRIQFRYLHRKYDYTPVPLDEYEKFIKADSLGSYFQSHIKDVYKTTYVPDARVQVAKVSVKIPDIVELLANSKPKRRKKPN